MNIKEILLELKLYGYSVIQSKGISQNLIDKMSNMHINLLNINNLNKSNYKGGSIITWGKELKSATKGQKTILNRFVKSKIVSSLLQSEVYRNYGLDSVSATLDLPTTSHIAQVPHFDRIPNLKFLIYLNDMTKKNGAFMVSPSSHHWVISQFDVLRPPFVSQKYFKMTRDIPPVILKNLIPIEGKKGTLIIFNTDTFHQQGLVDKGESRIIRFHFQSSKRLNKYYSLRERLGNYKLFIKKNFLFNI